MAPDLYRLPLREVNKKGTHIEVVVSEDGLDIDFHTLIVKEKESTVDKSLNIIGNFDRMDPSSGERLPEPLDDSLPLGSNANVSQVGAGVKNLSSNTVSHMVGKQRLLRAAHPNLIQIRRTPNTCIEYY